jgi:hypothetical protein
MICGRPLYGVPLDAATDRIDAATTAFLRRPQGETDA